MDQALNSQKTPHTSPLRASYGMSFVSILMKNDRVIKGFYCTTFGDLPDCLRQQAITWANVDPDLCHYMTLLVYNALNEKHFLIRGHLRLNMYVAKHL